MALRQNQNCGIFNECNHKCVDGKSADNERMCAAILAGFCVEAWATPVLSGCARRNVAETCRRTDGFDVNPKPTIESFRDNRKACQCLVKSVENQNWSCISTSPAIASDPMNVPQKSSNIRLAVRIQIIRALKQAMDDRNDPRFKMSDESNTIRQSLDELTSLLTRFDELIKSESIENRS